VPTKKKRLAVDRQPLGFQVSKTSKTND